MVAALKWLDDTTKGRRPFCPEVEELAPPS